MSILIGCSPSTGSSLLRRILNRHSMVFCGSETSLFAKEELYINWKKNKNKLTKPSIFGLSNAGWHNFIGVEFSEEYNISHKAFKDLIASETTTFSSFISGLYKPILEDHNKSIWAEKTPSNAFTLELFLNEFKNSKVIHLVRNPLDTIASLYNRGMSMYNATAVYLMNTAKGLELYDNDNCLTIHYEELVTRPKDILMQLCNFLDIPFEEKMHEATKAEKGIAHMDGWKYKETEKVQQGSIGRFQLMNPRLRTELMERIAMTYSSLDTMHKSIPDICTTLNYSLPQLISNNQSLLRFQTEKKEDMKSRYFKKAYFNRNNYPIYFSCELV